MNNFTKDDLKSGDVLLRRNGRIEIVISNLGVTVDSDGYTYLLEFLTEELASTYDPDYDVISIRRPNKGSECNYNIFRNRYGTEVYSERKLLSSRLMTITEIEDELGYPIIIRNESKGNI